jgi:hypothetical protein
MVPPNTGYPADSGWKPAQVMMSGAPDIKLTPRVDISDRFNVQSFKDGSRTYKYGNPEGVHGLEVHVDADGVLGFNIRAQGDSAIHGSGRDMFNSAMLRLKQDNVNVNQIRGYWESGTDSVNYSQFSNNINAMSQEQAALNTWTGQLAKDHGFGNIVSIHERFGDIVVIFGK